MYKRTPVHVTERVYIRTDIGKVTRLKFDILFSLKEALQRNCQSPKTAKTYYTAVKKVLENQQFSNASEIDQERLKESLSAIRSSSEFSAAKNGLKALQALYNDSNLPVDEWFESGAETKTRRRKTRIEPINLVSITHSVNALRDQRLKLGYRTALASGLRVSELEKLRAIDIAFLEDNRIRFTVRRGKGDKPREVIGLADPYLHARLQEHAATRGNDLLFYSESHMRGRAYEMGFECHDLRRVFAQDLRAERRAMGDTAYKANGAVMKALGHGRFRTTERYLRRKIIRGGDHSAKK